MADSLANDRVKYVAYGLVFTKPGHEQMMPLGEGSVVVTDNMSDVEFLSFLIAKYIEENRDREDYRKLVPKLIRSRQDWKYVKVHFITTRSWSPEPVDAERRQSDALDALRARLTEGS